MMVVAAAPSSCAPRTTGLRRLFLGRWRRNRMVSVKLETQFYPPVGYLPRGAMFPFVLDAMTGTGWNQRLAAMCLTISRA